MRNVATQDSQLMTYSDMHRFIRFLRYNGNVPGWRNGRPAPLTSSSHGGGTGIRARLRSVFPKGLWVRVPPMAPFMRSGGRTSPPQAEAGIRKDSAVRSSPRHHIIWPMPKTGFPVSQTNWQRHLQRRDTFLRLWCATHRPLAEFAYK